MLYKAKIPVRSDIHTKDVTTLYGHKVEFLNIQPGGT
jgi:hypothetical protein